MTRIAVGVEQVPCPVCRVREGRTCKNRRGYLVKAHRPRLEAWVELERAEAERTAAPHPARG